MSRLIEAMVAELSSVFSRLRNSRFRDSSKAEGLHQDHAVAV